MQKITYTYLTNLKATGEAQNISCGEGLVLRVSPKARKAGICATTPFPPKASENKTSYPLANSRHLV